MAQTKEHIQKKQKKKTKGKKKKYIFRLQQL
jgi:hypothetical protein